MMMRLRESGAVTSSRNNLPIIAFSIHNDPRPSVKVTLSVFMAKIAIFGLAKSGTTGLWSSLVKSYPRHYLQFFEGQFLPSRFNKYLGRRRSEKDPKDLINKEIIGPEFDFSCLEDYDKVIWLVRDPRDRLVSYILYRHYDHLYGDDDFVGQQLLLLEEKEQTPESVSLVDLETRLDLPRPTLNSAFFWNDNLKWDTLDTLITHGRTMLFRYEDYVDQNYAQVENFLGVHIKSHNNMPKQFRRVVRSKAHGFWRHWFTKLDLEHYQPLFQPFLERYGYGDDWRLANPREIEPDHCSRYVRRIINERREAEHLNPVI